jgi:hypothetical protein
MRLQPELAVQALADRRNPGVADQPHGYLTTLRLATDPTQMSGQRFEAAERLRVLRRGQVAAASGVASFQASVF